MILEIHGAGFKNKGAEMMLRTVTSELKERLPGFVPAIDPTYGRYDQRVELGLYQMMPQRSHVGNRGFAWHFAHQRLISSLPKSAVFRILGGGESSDYGCVTLDDVQGLIDIAGFAYTSHWGNKPTQDLARLTRYFKKRKKPVILLPQAFGPFESREIRSAFQEVIENSSLIFARDADSFNFLRELSTGSTEICQAPDITLFFPQKNYYGLNQDSRTVGIVPNARMLDQGKALWGNSYLNILGSSISYLLQRGLLVEILIHDASGQDRALAEEIKARIQSPQVLIVNEENPLLVKERISEYKLIIGSRYHSLVAALSTKVPVIALGWAHKYKLLLEEFDLNTYLLPPDVSIEEATSRIEHLLEEDVNESRRKQISRHLEQMSVTNQEMWNTVADTLTNC